MSHVQIILEGFFQSKAHFQQDWLENYFGKARKLGFFAVY